MIEVRVLPRTVYYPKWGLLDLYVERPERVDWAPGHFLGLGREGVPMAPYSIACPPDSDHLRFFIRIHEDGPITQHFKDLKPGDTLRMDGAPGGFFDIRKSESPDSMYVATSVGIAPLLSLESPIPLKVIIGSSYKDEGEFYFKELSKVRPEVIGHLVCSKEGTREHVQDFLRRFNLEDDDHFFLCGIPEMIAEVSEILNDRGKTWEQIETEFFV